MATASRQTDPDAPCVASGTLPRCASAAAVGASALVRAHSGRGRLARGCFGQTDSNDTAPRRAVAAHRRKTITHNGKIDVRRGKIATHRRKITTHRGFTLIELLTVVAVVGVLAALTVGAMRGARVRFNEAKSASNIRQLAAANITYAADHGRFVRDSNDGNNKRWFGSRASGGFTGSPGDDYGGSGGYLSDYLEGGVVRYCPVFLDLVDGNPDVYSSSQFEAGAGGYGYNSAYLGNTPDERYAGSTGGAGLGGKRPKPGAGEESSIVSSPGNLVSNVTDTARTVMFTSSAIVYGGALAQTGESVPPRMILPSGLGASMTPTTHFRFRGRALVAWADGHVTFEEPNTGDNSWNVYGGNNAKYRLGWFGPTEYNGYWNPRSAEKVPY